MPHLLNQSSEPEIKDGSSLTAAQKFFLHYATAVDSKAFTEGSGLKYYSKDMVFHNQNNAEYHGADQMWAWMKQIFGQFERLRHDILQMWDIKQDDGTSLVMLRMVRNVWVLGNTGEEPNVSAPTFWVCKIGPADYADAHEGLQFKEVWLYWDTMLLAPFMGKDAVAFKTKNILEHK